jgi:hypothetical protein
MKYDKRNGTTNFTNERRLSDVRGKEVTRGDSNWFIGGDVSKMTVYRPTVRYSPVFKDYVDSVFRATTLDRNQIIRAALYTAAHSMEFQELLKQYQKKTSLSPAQNGGFLTTNSGWNNAP